MASMNDIKARMKSVSGTMQITKAMELVATSKLRRAKADVEAVRPYLACAEEAIVGLLSLPETRESVYVKEGVGPTLYIVIAGDRGLAGGYNANVFRLAASIAGKEESVFLPLGKKSYEHYRHRGATLLTDACLEIADIGVGECIKLAHYVCARFAEGKLGRVELVYTDFTSMMTQTTKHKTILPLTLPEHPVSEAEVLEDREEMLRAIVPDYLGGVLFSATRESLASESGARRTAMNSASSNAKDMMDELTLRYNRARQAVITQEITEIVSGAEAL